MLVVLLLYQLSKSMALAAAVEEDYGSVFDPRVEFYNYPAQLQCQRYVDDPNNHSVVPCLRAMSNAAQETSNRVIFTGWNVLTSFFSWGRPRFAQYMVETGDVVDSFERWFYDPLSWLKYIFYVLVAGGAVLLWLSFFFWYYCWCCRKCVRCWSKLVSCNESCCYYGQKGTGRDRSNPPGRASRIKSKHSGHRWIASRVLVVLSALFLCVSLVFTAIYLRYLGKPDVWNKMVNATYDSWQIVFHDVTDVTSGYFDLMVSQQVFRHNIEDECPSVRTASLLPSSTTSYQRSVSAPYDIAGTTPTRWFNSKAGALFPVSDVARVGMPDWLNFNMAPSPGITLGDYQENAETLENLFDMDSVPEDDMKCKSTMLVSSEVLPDVWKRMSELSKTSSWGWVARQWNVRLDSKMNIIEDDDYSRRYKGPGYSCYFGIEDDCIKERNKTGKADDVLSAIDAGDKDSWAYIDPANENETSFGGRRCGPAFFSGLYRSSPDKEADIEWHADAVMPGDVVYGQALSMSADTAEGPASYLHRTTSMVTGTRRQAFHLSVFDEIRTGYGVVSKSMPVLAAAHYIDLFTYTKEEAAVLYPLLPNGFPASMNRPVDKKIRTPVRTDTVQAGLAYIKRFIEVEEPCPFSWQAAAGSIFGGVASSEDNQGGMPLLYLYNKMTHDEGSYGESANYFVTPGREMADAEFCDDFATVNIYSAFGGWTVDDFVNFYGVYQEYKGDDKQDIGRTRSLLDMSYSLQYGIADSSGIVDWKNPPPFVGLGDIFEGPAGETLVNPSPELMSPGRILAETPNHAPFNYLDGPFSLIGSWAQVAFGVAESTLHDSLEELMTSRDDMMPEIVGVYVELMNWFMPVRGTGETTWSVPAYMRVSSIIAVTILLFVFVFFFLIYCVAACVTLRENGVPSSSARALWICIYIFLMLSTWLLLPFIITASLGFPLVMEATSACLSNYESWLVNPLTDGEPTILTEQLSSCLFHGDQMSAEELSNYYDDVQLDVSEDSLELIMNVIDSLEYAFGVGERWHQAPSLEELTELLYGYAVPKIDPHQVLFERPEGLEEHGTEHIPMEFNYFFIEGVADALRSAVGELRIAVEFGLQGIYVHQPRGVLANHRHYIFEKPISAAEFVRDNPEDFAIVSDDILEPLLHSLVPQELIVVETDFFSKGWNSSAEQLVEVSLALSKSRAIQAIKKHPNHVLTTAGAKLNYAMQTVEGDLWTRMGFPADEKPNIDKDDRPIGIYSTFDEKANESNYIGKLIGDKSEEVAARYDGVRVDRNKRPAHWHQLVSDYFKRLPTCEGTNPICVCSSTGQYVTGQLLCDAIDDPCTASNVTVIRYIPKPETSGKEVSDAQCELLSYDEMSYEGREPRFRHGMAWMFFEDPSHCTSHQGYPLFPPRPMTDVFLSEDNWKDGAVPSTELLKWRDCFISKEELFMFKSDTGGVENPEFDMVDGETSRMEFLTFIAAIQRVQQLVTIEGDIRESGPPNKEMLNALLDILPGFNEAEVQEALARSQSEVIGVMRDVVGALGETYNPGTALSRMIDCKELHQSMKSTFMGICGVPLGLVNALFWSIMGFCMTYLIMWFVMFKHLTYFRDLSSKDEPVESDLPLLDKIRLEACQDPDELEKLVKTLYADKHDQGGRIDVGECDSRYDYQTKLIKDSKDNEFNTCLHYSVQRNYHEVTAWLLKNGADVDAENMNNYTPLHVAAQMGHDHQAELILDAGAETVSHNKWRDTALGIAGSRYVDHVHWAETADDPNGFDLKAEARTFLVIGGARCSYSGHDGTVEAISESKPSSSHRGFPQDVGEPAVLNRVSLCEKEECDGLRSHTLDEWVKAVETPNASFLLPIWVQDHNARDSGRRQELTIRDRYPIMIDDLLIRRGIEASDPFLHKVREFMKIQAGIKDDSDFKEYKIEAEKRDYERVLRLIDDGMPIIYVPYQPKSSSTVSEETQWDPQSSSSSSSSSSFTGGLQPWKRSSRSSNRSSKSSR